MVAVVPSNLVSLTVNGSLYVRARLARNSSANASPSSSEVGTNWEPNVEQRYALDNQFETREKGTLFIEREEKYMGGG